MINERDGIWVSVGRLQLMFLHPASTHDADGDAGEEWEEGDHHSNSDVISLALIGGNPVAMSPS